MGPLPRPILCTELGDLGRLKGGRIASRVVPGPEKTALLADGIGRGASRRWLPIRAPIQVGDLDALARPREAPAMEGTPNRVALHLTTDPEMGAEMRAMGV